MTRFKKPNKKTVIGLAIILAIVIGIAIIIWLNIVKNNSLVNSNSPTHATILPVNKNIESLGGWSRISPPGKDPVFAYSDNIKGAPVIISQQELPDSFKKNVDREVADLAKSYNASAKLDSGGTIVYIGASVSGHQSVIFVKKDVLVLIKSQQKIKDADWSAYIESLQ